MFTGIVAAVGKINAVSPLAGTDDAGVRLEIDLIARYVERMLSASKL